jgi:hypothetical protein
MTYRIGCLAASLCVAAIAQNSIIANAQNPIQCRADKVPDYTPLCSPNALAGYPSNTCVVKIDRTIPFSPLALAVPKRTIVYIEIDHPRLNENIQFLPTFAGVSPQDILGAAVQTLAGGPLQNLVASIKTVPPPNAANAMKTMNLVLNQTEAGTPILKNIQTIQRAAAKRLATASSVIAEATIKLNCLQAYEGTEKRGNNISCTVYPFKDDQDFKSIETNVANAIRNAANLDVDLGDLAEVDGLLKDAADNCKDWAEGGSNVPQKPIVQQSDCKEVSKYEYYQRRLDDNMADVLSSQKSLQSTLLILDTLPDAIPPQVFCISMGKNIGGSVAVSSQIPPQATPTTIATVPITFGLSRWNASTGIGFSFAGANSYSNAPLLMNGQPVLDSSGKNETVVTRTTTKPTILFPVVMGHYMIPGMNQWLWENSCPHHCGFQLSGGVGANLTATQKSADFLGGVSFQFGSVFVTPAAHVTWDSQLTGGVYEGAKLGSSPPAPLPTKRSLVTKFSINVTCVIPGLNGSFASK